MLKRNQVTLINNKNIKDVNQSIVSILAQKCTIFLIVTTRGKFG
jgi:hypothetical protein